MNLSAKKSRELMMFCLLLATILTSSCNSTGNNETIPSEQVLSVPNISYSVTNSYLHDKSLFTEGLVFHDRQLFESTGSPEELPYTESKVGIDDISKGLFFEKIKIDKKKFFGEGIVFLNKRLFQLTYKNHTGFIYDAKSFVLLKTFSFSNPEGWGLTTDGRFLIMSDGSNRLTYLDPDSLKPVKVLNVVQNDIRRDSLNELEFIKGFIYANIWQNDVIVKIDPNSGKVIGQLDIHQLSFKMHVLYPDAEVANGIAYDSVTDKIYLTGKLWPYIFEIKL